MRGPHLLRVLPEASPFAALFAALHAAGLRAGWLELKRPDPPPDLEAAAGLGAARAVAVGEGRSVAVKPMRGPAVLRDLLREHFAGCSVVLVAAAEEATGELATAPLVSPAGEGWRVAVPGLAVEHLDSQQLIARLRRPRPWSLETKAPPPAAIAEGDR